MKFSKRILAVIFAATGMLILILDSRNALQSASEGIKLCIQIVVPALFPFFVVSVILTSSLSGISVPAFGLLSKAFHIPKGSESILLTGFLGGYPIGAQCITDAWRSGSLDKNTAKRMLGFCSNAGPSFIFGITGTFFDLTEIPWILWLIQIISALFTAQLLPEENGVPIKMNSRNNFSLTDAVKRSIHAIAVVSGWVILFRILIGFLDRWILWLLPKTASVCIAGLLELTNGCCALLNITNEQTRFVLCSLFLSFGGLCVSMQTVSVTHPLGTGLYFPGKLIQTSCSVILSIAILPVLYPGDSSSINLFLLPLLSCICLYARRFHRKKVKNSSIQELIRV